MSAINSWNLSFDEDLELWADLGIDHVGLFLQKIEPVGADRAVAAVREAGLRVSTLACRGFELYDRATWPERQAGLLEAVEVAEAVDAASMFVTAGAPGHLGWDDCVRALADALQPVYELGAQRGVPIGVEHTNPMRRDLGFVHTLHDAVEVARRLDVGVVVEVTNCWYERNLDATIADGADTFQVVQLSDYVVGTVVATERAVPGDGDIPLAHIVGTMCDAGFAGPFELEMLGPRVEAEGYRPAIARAVAVLDEMLTEAAQS